MRAQPFTAAHGTAHPKILSLAPQGGLITELKLQVLPGSEVLGDNSTVILLVTHLIGLATSGWSYSMVVGSTTTVNGALNNGSGTYYLDRTTATNNLTGLKAVGGKPGLQSAMMPAEVSAA